MGGQIETVRNAIDLAKRMLATHSDGHALSMICMSFLADHSGNDISAVFSRLEEVTGMDIIAVSSDNDSVDIVYGVDAINRLAGALSEEEDE